MALIQDPDLLNVGIEIVIDPAAKTIQLLIAGNLSNDGVTLQALYSFLKIKWNDGTYINYPFPMEAITPEQFEFINGWLYADQTTINLFRTGGFAVRNSSGVSVEEYAGIISLGDVEPGGVVYYQQEVDGVTTNIVLSGKVNQCIKIYGDVNNGNIDYRNYLKLFLREYAMLYSASQISDIGVTTLTYQVYRFPLTNAEDIKITHDDTVVDLYGVTVTYYAVAQTRDLGNAGIHNFDIIINGNNRTIEEIYEAIQSKLRKNIDIDAGVGTVIGNTTDVLLGFVGEILRTQQGVFIDNLQDTDKNSVEFTDTSGVPRKYPYIAAGTIVVDDDLVNDTSAKYMMLYDYDDKFGTSLAEKVLDAAGNPIQGIVTQNNISFNYDFDYDDGGNGFEGTEKDIIVIASGLETAQYVLTRGTISRSTTNTFRLDAVKELNYI